MEAVQTRTAEVPKSFRKGVMQSVLAILFFNIPVLGLLAIFFAMKAKTCLNEARIETQSSCYRGKEIKPFTINTWSFLAVACAVMSVLFTFFYIGLAIYMQSELNSF